MQALDLSPLLRTAKTYIWMHMSCLCLHMCLEHASWPKLPHIQYRFVFCSRNQNHNALMPKAMRNQTNNDQQTLWKHIDIMMKTQRANPNHNRNHHQQKPANTQLNYDKNTAVQTKTPCETLRSRSRNATSRQ